MRGMGLLSGVVIALSFIMAMMLDMVPLPHHIEWLRPHWVLLVTIYWIIALPYRVSVGIAWFVGLLLDASYGSLLGQHALALALVAYWVAKFHRQARLFPMAQQMLIVALLVFMYQFVLMWLAGLIGEHLFSWGYWLSPMTSALLWPFVFLMLRDSRRRFKVQ